MFMYLMYLVDVSLDPCSSQLSHSQMQTLRYNWVPADSPSPTVLSSFPEQVLVLLVLTFCRVPVSDTLVLLAPGSLPCALDICQWSTVMHPDVSSCWHPKHTGPVMGGFTPVLALRPKHKQAPTERAPSLRTTFRKGV